VDGGVEAVFREAVYDDAVEPRGEPFEEAQREVVGERPRDELVFEGDVDGEAFAGTDGKAELAVVGVSEEEEGEALLVVSGLEALLEDADDLDLDFIRAGGHVSRTSKSR
jgi:hypothetical protein